MGLDELLDELAAYAETPEDSCFSLPPDAYISPELHRLETRAIFERSWLCVGREEYAPEPGDYYTLDVMGEPVAVVHGTDGRYRALNAACRHRYMPVIEGRGNARRFVCPYHSWTYATDGRLLGAPHMEGSRVFDRASCRLPAYRLEAWRGFLFVNLDDDAPPLTATVASMDAATANYRIEEQTEVFHYETTWNGNWKLSAENSMEYYHHIGLHAATVGVQMPASGTYFPDRPAVDVGTDQGVGHFGDQHRAVAHPGHRHGGRGDRTVGTGHRSRHPGHRVVGMTTAAAQLVVGRTGPGADLGDPDLGEDLVGRQRGHHRVDEEVGRGDLPSAARRSRNHGRSEGQRRHRLVGRHVGVDHRPAAGTAVADLAVAGPRGGGGQRRAVLLDEAAGSHLGMGDQGADRDGVAVVGDLSQPADAPDVHHRVG